MKQFIQQLKLHRESPLILGLWCLVFYGIGFGMLCLIFTLDDTATTWIPAATIFGCMGLVLYSILTFLGYPQKFMLALSFGRTRREFLIGYALEHLLLMIGAYMLVLGLSWLEEWLYNLLFPGIVKEFDLFPYLIKPGIMVPVIAGLVVIPMFLGALYSRFGKVFCVIAYVVWIGGCLSLPRLAHGPLGIVLDWATAIPAGAWAGLGLAVAAIMICITVRIGQKQMVR